MFAVFGLIACTTYTASTTDETSAQTESTQNNTQTATSNRDVTIDGDYWTLPNTSCIEELLESTRDVFRAEVICERQEWMRPDGFDPDEDPGTRLFLVYRLLILEVFQGNLVPGEIVEVRQRLQHPYYVREGDLDYYDIQEIISRLRFSIAVGDDIVLFTTIRNIDMPHGHLPTNLVLPIEVHRVPPQEGMTNSDGSRSSVANYDGELKRFPGNTTLTVSIEDLVNIAQRNGIETGRDIPNFAVE